MDHLNVLLNELTFTCFSQVLVIIMPGIRITDEDRNEIGHKFMCTICNLLLSDPMQTFCGHLMCTSCVDDLLESSNPRCPDDGTELDKEHVFLDAFMKRELQALSLHCPNPGCGWLDTYVELEAHSQVCEHPLINCVHAQCKMKFQRFHLGEHLKKECEYRSMKCNYCHKDTVFASLKDHVRTSCEGAPVTCKFCKEKVLRRDIERHEQVFCKNVPVECEFKDIGCCQMLKRSQLRQHMKDNIIEHQLLEARMFRVIRSESSKKLDMIGQSYRSLQDECRARNQGGSDSEKNKSIIQKDPFTQQPIHSYNGTLLWKIDGYQRKRQDAINGVKRALYSPPFYSAQYGYKLCAKIYMNGDGFGKGSHLSLFFVVMKGDYDALQTWPFQKKITMMLLDQGNGDHMVDVFHSDPQSSSFQRPKSDMNIASGSSLFMPIDNLNNRQYIKDDVMFIKITVE